MKVFNKSVIGSSHIVSGLKCQDSSLYEIFEYNQVEAIVMAVSDGHGSETYVRSDIGSQLACKIAIDETKRFVIANYETLVNKGKTIISYTPDSRIPQDSFFANLFDVIHNRWYEGIRRQAIDYPFSEVEKRKLGNHDIKQAYGCTLMVSVKTKDFVFAYHIGDGRLFTISYYNDWVQPVPWDSDCEDNITTSLCEDEPVSRFRYYLDSTPSQPLAIFMCSDGIEDCYGGSHDKDFESEELIVDYSEVIRCFMQDDDYEDAIPQYLSNQSEKLSHDDMSIVFVVDDVYNLMDCWLKLSEIRRLQFGIESKLESFENDIKECENRIKNVQSLHENYKKNFIQYCEIKAKKEEEYTKVLNKETIEKDCSESASSLQEKIEKIQHDINEICDEFIFQSNNNNIIREFRSKLATTIKNAIKRIIEYISKEEKEKEAEVSKCTKRKEQLETELEEINVKIKQEEDSLKDAENRLSKLQENIEGLRRDFDQFKKETEPKKNIYTTDIKGTKDKIEQVLPFKTNVPEEKSQEKVLNICKMKNGYSEKDLTIYFSQDKAECIWGEGERFPIQEEIFKEIKDRIKGIDPSCYQDDVVRGEYLTIMLPFVNEDGVIKNVSFAEKEAIELWDLCLSIIPN